MTDVPTNDLELTPVPAPPEIKYSHEQELAIELCCDVDEVIASVTGGAGTGKTTILKEVYSRLIEEQSVVLCAPTGRAAKRISEATGLHARTIHKLLEFPRPDDDDIADPKKAPKPGSAFDYAVPRRNKDNPLAFRVVLVDESSMLGPVLFRQLVDALPRPHGVIRFFGDSNQLPPVEEGLPPFRTMLKTKPSVTLTHNYRSDDELISNALRILSARIPLNNNRFTTIYTENPLQTMLKFVTVDFAKDDFQIITPARKGKFGTMMANPRLQLKFNRNAPYIRLDRLKEKDEPIVVRQNDKFLWIQNDYGLNMFNGEIGRIDDLDEESGDLWLSMTDRERLHVPPRLQGRGMYGPYQYDPRKQIELGYAITTHKAQGSEFDTVLYYMTGHTPFLLNRNNLYTAVTRAKKMVVIICDRRAMGASIKKRI